MSLFRPLSWFKNPLKNGDRILVPLQTKVSPLFGIAALFTENPTLQKIRFESGTTPSGTTHAAIQQYTIFTGIHSA
jgi:hypothetical protein